MIGFYVYNFGEKCLQRGTDYLLYRVIKGIYEPDDYKTESYK
jgi:hypothetical protein